MEAFRIGALLNEEFVLREIEKQLGVVATHSTTLEELGIDSLDFISLMQVMNIPKEKYPSINTVGDIVRACENVPA